MKRKKNVIVVPLQYGLRSLLIDVEYHFDEEENYKRITPLLRLGAIIRLQAQQQETLVYVSFLVED